MNVTDKWMLEQMQQMAASMATTLPQTGQNSEPAKTEKGESFQDLMNKAKDKPVEAPQKEDSPAQKTENAPSEKPVQKTGEARKVEVTRNPDGTETKTVNLTAQEAAMVAAGYAKLFAQEDGTVMLVTVQDENGEPILPLVELEQTGGVIPLANELLASTGEEWAIEPTPEFVEALEQLLQKTNDPRSVDDILSGLEQKVQNTETAEPQLEIVVKTPGPEQSTGTEQEEDQDAGDGQEAGAMTASQPLFRDVKAAPVKVGENFQLDTQEPDMDQQLADTIRAAAQEGLKQIEIKLSPENLGNLTIKLTQASDGTLQVVLHATNDKAANLLTQHLSGLNTALQGYGQGEVRVEIQRGDDSQQAEQHQQHQTDPDGHNRQQQEQQHQHRQESEHDGDFIQKLRLGLFSLESGIERTRGE